jgi:protoporphyrinogen oxidase
MKRIAVIGAGPAGLTAGYKLAKAGMNVTVYEAESKVGGMAKTIELWGQKVDIGPHRFFSNERRINELWLEVVQNEYAMIQRLTRIYYKNKFFYYPLKAMDALLNLGITEATKCIISYLISLAKTKIKSDDHKTFESWVVSRFGYRLYEIFFKTYSEKLWGISCKDLDADFAAQRIKKLSLFEAVLNSIVGGKNNKHKTLVDQFAYPFGGTGTVYKKMSEIIQEMGGILHLSKSINGVVNKDKQITGIELEDGTIENFNHVISTMPITTMVKSLNDTPIEVLTACEKLRFRNTILVYLEIDVVDIFPDNWIYVHSPNMLCGRITNFRNWIPDLYNNKKTTIVCLEFWTNFNESLWKKSETELSELAREEMLNTGLMGNGKILNYFIYKIPRSYPVYNAGYKENLNIIINHLKSLNGLTPIGRYGAFKYNNQDHSILMGLLVADNLINNRKHDLWHVNTDDEYQEEAKINATGLEVPVE